MRRHYIKPLREHVVPKGALKISDKQSSAVVYVYERDRGDRIVPLAIAFHGKAQKPDWHFNFATPAKREQRIRAHFESIRHWEQRNATRAGTRTAFVHSYKVGDVFKTCWGYDQTNVEYFECTKLIGKKMIEVREIACETISDGERYMSGKSVPMLGTYKGEPLRRLAQERGVKIDECRTAYKAEPTTVAGAKVYQPSSYSWGH